MAEKIQSIKGMNDILNDTSARWQTVERRIFDVLERYGYQEIRTPIVEKTQLFKRSIGELTDIVSKEMYTFEDRNGESLTLRPEGTASCVRAGLQHSLFQDNILRLWYMGPMFRRERPQKGRTRQFHQIGVEVFGLEGPDIDAEVILLSARMWKELGLNDFVLQLNTLGTPVSRQHYREVLIEYFSDHKEILDADSANRLQRNPLRILDSKNPDMQDLIAVAPTMAEYMDEESREHFEGLQALLNAAGLVYEINPRLVRGLDYYTKTVFEWVTDRLGAQGTICAGGRYDGLVETFGGKPTPGVGFAMGLERLVEVYSESTSDDGQTSPHAYLISVGDEAISAGFKLAESLRDQLPGLRLLHHCGGGSFKSQFKKADKSGAQLALVLGEDELRDETLGIKFLRQERGQQQVPWQQLAITLKQEFAL